jgi:hypothetical protein
VVVGNFHRFVNKAVAIAANDRGIRLSSSKPLILLHMLGTAALLTALTLFTVFLPLADVCASLSTPTPTSNQASDVHAFLCLAGPTTQSAEQVLRLLTEERRAIQREGANMNLATLSPLLSVI